MVHNDGVNSTTHSYVSVDEVVVSQFKSQTKLWNLNIILVYHVLFNSSRIKYIDSRASLEEAVGQARQRISGEPHTHC